MRFTRAKVVAVAAVALAMALPGRPAQAVGPTDPTGLDFDAASPSCPPVTVPPANSVQSPGSTTTYCSPNTTYDGGAESFDLRGVDLTNDASGRLVARFSLDQGVPLPGDLLPPLFNAAFDSPDNSRFTGGSYFALFQNYASETWVPRFACRRNTEHVLGIDSGVRVPPDNMGPSLDPTNTKGDYVYHRWGAAADGFHFFVGFDASWDGRRWVWRVYLGEYFPGAKTGFRFWDLGSAQNHSAGIPTWTSANPNHTYGTGVGQWEVSYDFVNNPKVITVRAPGVYQEQSSMCHASTPNYLYDFARAGDSIRHIKGLTTANTTATPHLPHEPCRRTEDPHCSSDVTPIESFAFADTTQGQSMAGLFGTNTTGIAYSYGSERGSDTKGPGPSCPTPTYGGFFDENPLWLANNSPSTPPGGVACHIDDDPVARGSSYPEWWETGSNFTF